MRSILICMVCFLPIISFAQEEQAASKSISEKFVNSYNGEDYESIFSLYADIMKEALPLDKHTAFLSGLNMQVGNIEGYEFLRYENGTYASYKANFEKAVLTLNISLDSASMINGLFIKPYVEPVNTDIVQNKLEVLGTVFGEDEVQQVFDQVKVFPNNTQLSMAIINEGKIEYYGVLKAQDMVQTIRNSNSVFEIGSISKVFTATLLADLVEEGKISLDDNIGTYLDTPIKDETPLLFRDLSNHSSGLPRLPSNLDLEKVDPFNPYKAYNEDALKTYLKNSVALSGKGNYQYSNLAVGLLGYTLAKIEQTSYEDLLSDRIFSELKMTNSTSRLEKVEGKLVKGLNIEGNEVSNWDLAILAGAGGILSTTEDLGKFMEAQFNKDNKAQALTRVKTLTLNENMDLGLGWHIINTEAGSKWHFHNGATGGYSSIMVTNVDTQNGVIILSNVAPDHPNAKNVETLCFELMEQMEKE